MKCTRACSPLFTHSLTLSFPFNPFPPLTTLYWYVRLSLSFNSPTSIHENDPTESRYTYTTRTERQKKGRKIEIGLDDMSIGERLYTRMGAPAPFDPQHTFVTSPVLSATILAIVRFVFAFYTLFTILFVLIWDEVKFGTGDQ